MKPLLNITTGTMFDFGKPLPKLDVVPAYYFDTTPNETRQSVEAMLASIPTSPEGQFCGKELMERVKAFVANPDPKAILITIDSYSPMT